MTFEEALENIKNGQKVTRKSWYQQIIMLYQNNIIMVTQEDYEDGSYENDIDEEDSEEVEDLIIEYLDEWGFKPDSDDLLADDWQLSK